MASQQDLNVLPPDLPIPIDDGAADHLRGMKLPDLSLRSTAGDSINLVTIAGRTVVYIYPRTGRPDQPSPPGWNEIPGARGCTAQSCAFRDHYQELGKLGLGVFGLSTQDSDYQTEAVNRLNLPFPLLSDADFVLTRALSLPTFDVDEMTLLKRLTLIINNGRIEYLFYPVFPPDQNADAVIKWLEAHPSTAQG